MGKFFLFLILAMSFSGIAWGGSELEKKAQPASSVDVAGTWEMIYQKNGNLIPNNDPYVYAHQRFCFSPDGYVKNIAAAEPLSKEILRMWETAPRTSKYKFTNPGVIVIEGTEGDKTLIVISVITADMEKALSPDAPKLKKGDLLLSYLDQNKQIYLRRYLRKVN